MVAAKAAYWSGPADARSAAARMLQGKPNCRLQRHPSHGLHPMGSFFGGQTKPMPSCCTPQVDGTRVGSDRRKKEPWTVSAL